MEQDGFSGCGDERRRPLGHHGADTREQVGHRSDIEVRRIRIRRWPPIVGILIDVDQLMGPRERQGPKRKRIDRAEDRGVRPDAERQNGQRSNRETWRAGETFETIADVERQPAYMESLCVL